MSDNRIREEIAELLRQCVLVHNEPVGLLVIGSVRIWQVMQGRKNAPPDYPIQGTEEAPVTLNGMKVLIITMEPNILMAVPASQARKVERRLRKLGKEAERKKPCTRP
jgi:hypothetical protein